MHERICQNCIYYEYEHDMKTYICGDPDGEYFGEPVREREHCPDWSGKEEE